MPVVEKNNTAIYEGNAPYLFVSYSHKDVSEMESVRTLLNGHQIRYWYDDGLHSGDDWNAVIAEHLKNAAICLLLLSPNSASSTYVKNELNFAMNHRIPIHTLLLKSFNLPADIEMMTGRIQMVEMRGDYGTELVKSFPAEIFYNVDTAKNRQAHTHPIYQIGEKQYERQGTTTFAAKHKSLHYPCTVHLDVIRPSDQYEIQNLCVLAGNVNHPIFPKIYDVEFRNNQMWTYQENGQGQFLDRFLETHELPQETIRSWIQLVVDGMEYLYNNNLGLRDFARGSIFATDNTIRISRLQNTYYGLVVLQEETKQYYFEKEIGEIAILIAQLCNRSVPSLPIQILKESRLDENFIEIMNLIIQKCAKENGKSRYNSFAQVKKDLALTRIRFKDKLFLNTRKKQLECYYNEKQARTEIFTSDDVSKKTRLPESQTGENLEEKFGFEATVMLGSNQTENGLMPSAKQWASKIEIRICSTGC